MAVLRTIQRLNRTEVPVKTGISKYKINGRKKNRSLRNTDSKSKPKSTLNKDETFHYIFIKFPYK